MTHTPGPWHATPGCSVIGPAPAGHMIADVRFSLRADEDARLIAAAPDMLRALGDTVLALQKLGLDGWSDTPYLMKVCSEAIAKATQK
jgi:hypothetical protein